MIRAESVRKTFRQEGHDIRAVDDLNFVLRPGETLGLVGESGSGKTTLARTLLGLIAADEGSIIELDGGALAEQITKRGRDDVRALQIVFQNPDSALNRRFSVQRILSRALEKLRGDSGGEREEHLRELAHSVRFDTRLIHSRPAQLSGGLKQRVAIARAFAGEPRVVVCDEPTSALDVSVQAAILNLLAELQAEKGVTYLFISHDLGVVRYLSDRIAVLYLGPADGARRRRDRVQPAAPSLHRGAAVLDPAGRRRGARADPARGRDPEPRATRRPAASSTPAARATSATSAISRSRSSRRSSPATSGAATTRSRSCASCRRARRSSGRAAPTRRRAAATRPRARRPEADSEPAEEPPPRPRASAEGPRRRPGAGRSAARGRRSWTSRRPGRARCSCGCTRAASATPTSTRSTARRRRAVPPCSGTRARASSSRWGRAWRWRPARASCSPGCRRAGAAPSACASSATCARRRGARWRPAGCSTAGRGCRAAASRSTTTRSSPRSPSGPSCPAACCVPIPDDVPFDVAALVGCAVATGTGAVWRTAGVRPGERVAVFGCGGVGMSAVLGALAVGADPVDRGRRGARQARGGGGARGDACRRAGRATPRRPPSGCSRPAAAASTTRSRRRGGPRRRSPRSSPRRARGAAVLIGIPPPDAMLTLPGAADPAHGAAHPRLDLRLLAAGARLPGAARALPPRPAAARPARHAPAAARRGGGGVRGDARRRRRCAWCSTWRCGMMRSAGRADRRGLVRRGARTGATSTSSLARRGSPTAAAAAGALAGPRPGHLPFLACLVPGRRRAADDDRGQQVADRGRRRARAAHLGRRAARHRPGRARRRRRRRARRRPRSAEIVLLVAVWVDPDGARRDRGQAANRDGDARRRSPTPSRRRRRRRRAGARRRAARTPRTPTTAAAEPCGSPPSRSGATACALDPPFRAAWDPGAARAQRGDARDRARRRRHARATRAAASCPTPRCSSGCSSASTRAAPRSCASCARPSTSTAGGRGPPRSRSGTSPRGALGEPLWRLLGGRSERMLAYASSGELVAPDERARRVDGAARRRRARGQAALPPRRLARGRRGRRGRARRGRRRRRADGRRQPRLAHGRRPRRRAGTSPTRDPVRARARAARRLLARGAAADRTTSRATRGCAPAPRCGSPPARWCAACTRRAT